MKKVAFQGKRGAYSEVAIYEYFSKDTVEACGYDLSEEVFESVGKKEVDFAVVPFENSIAGNVDVNVDLFYENDYYIIGEIYLPIIHCLLGKPGTTLNDIEVVHSHPVALAQCRGYLRKHKIKTMADFDTAGAAEKISLNTSKKIGSISSKLCSEYYHLELLDEGIQDVDTNITRFKVFVSKENIPTHLQKEKTSVAFRTNHKPGSLLEVLKLFAEYDLNLTKLESRPVAQNPFQYIFFVDFLGSDENQGVQECFTKIQEYTHSLRVLGSYPCGSY